MAVHGDFDVAGSPDVVTCLDELVDAGCTRLLLDLRGVTFADASALGVLLRTRRRLQADGGELRVVYRGNPYVERLLEVTGLRGLLD